MKPKVSLLVSVWGRVVIVLVNERVSINTPKASFSASTTNQQSLFSPAAEREQYPESRLTGEGLTQTCCGREAGERLWKGGRGETW